MPARSRYRLNNPYLNEFVFQCLLTAPQDVKNRLPINLLRFTHSVEKMKGFAETATLEKKLEMVSRLGGAFSLALHPPGYLSKEKLHEILDNYLSNNRLGDIDEMLEKNVFVITNREIMAIHTVMAMNCHSETYMLNRDYALIATKIAHNKLNTRINDVEHIKTVMEDHKLVCKFMLYNLLNQNFVDSTNGYKSKELMILNFLFLNRNKYVELSTIHDFFRTEYSARIVNVTLNKLEASHHVIKFPKHYRYAIGGIGIQVLGSYLNRIINHTLSY